MQDVKDRKPIRIQSDPPDEEDIDLATPLNNLSLKLQDVLPAMLHVDYLEKKALRLLNDKKAVVEYPTLGDEQCKRFMVARKMGQFCSVKVTCASKVTCDCKGFR